jgi:phosphate-selective porin OprO and OprP
VLFSKVTLLPGIFSLGCMFLCGVVAAESPDDPQDRGLGLMRRWEGRSWWRPMGGRRLETSPTTSTAVPREGSDAWPGGEPLAEPGAAEVWRPGMGPDRPSQLTGISGRSPVAAWQELQSLGGVSQRLSDENVLPGDVADGDPYPLGTLLAQRSGPQQPIFDGPVGPFNWLPNLPAPLQQSPRPPLWATDGSDPLRSQIGDFANETELQAEFTGTAELERPKPTTNVTVELQTDFAWFGQSTENRDVVGNIPDGAFFRRSRLGVFGELYETVEYRVEWDFAEPARPRFLDNWIALTDIPIVRNVIVGHFFEPFSLERYTPNRFITFTERSVADTFAPARNIGMMTYGNALEGRMAWAVGAFRANSDDYGADVGFESGWATTVHATCLPWYIEQDEYTRYLMHLGGSYSYRRSGGDPIRFASAPEVRLRQEGVGRVPAFVDTGEFEGDSFQLFGVESAIVHGPLSIQGEWIAAPVNRTDGVDPVFHGGYAYVSWFLTGESRSYSPTSILGRFREGIFQRVVPRTNVFDRRSGDVWSGTGAIELAARWSYIKLDSVDIRGGFLQDITAGVNWYLNPNTKVMFNYVVPILETDADGRSLAHAFALRLQWEH